MLGLGLQATLKSQASGQSRPVQDGLVLADNFRLSPVNDNLGLDFPSNGSAVFNGTSDYISLDSDITITSDGTISFWVYYESGTSTIVSQMPYTPSTTYFTLSPSLQISVPYTDRGSVSDKIQSSASVFEANKWEYITLTIDNYSPQFYVNGSAVTTTQTGTYASGESIVVNTMGMVNNIYWMNGNLANVAIWNRALTSDEINSVMWKNYSQVTNSERVGLQAWYALDNIDGTSVPDSTGNYNGTAY
jgi:hypothetical protein